MYLFKDIKMASANERIFYFFRKRMHLQDSKQLCPASKNDFLMIVENLPLPFFDFFSPPPLYTSFGSTTFVITKSSSPSPIIQGEDALAASWLLREKVYYVISKLSD